MAATPELTPSSAETAEAVLTLAVKGLETVTVPVFPFKSGDQSKSPAVEPVVKDLDA